MSTHPVAESFTQLIRRLTALQRRYSDQAVLQDTEVVLDLMDSQTISLSSALETVQQLSRDAGNGTYARELNEIIEEFVSCNAGASSEAADRTPLEESQLTPEPGFASSLLHTDQGHGAAGSYGTVYDTRYRLSSPSSGDDTEDREDSVALVQLAESNARDTPTNQSQSISILDRAMPRAQPFTYDGEPSKSAMVYRPRANERRSQPLVSSSSSATAASYPSLQHPYDNTGAPVTRNRSADEDPSSSSSSAASTARSRSKKRSAGESSSASDARPYTHWTVEEDEKLKAGVHAYGSDWVLICKKLKDKTPTQASQRWTRALKPNLRKGTFTAYELQNVMNVVQRFNAEWYDTAKKSAELPAPPERGFWARVSAAVGSRSDHQCRRACQREFQSMRVAFSATEKEAMKKSLSSVHTWADVSAKVSKAGTRGQTPQRPALSCRNEYLSWSNHDPATVDRLDRVERNQSASRSAAALMEPEP